MNHNLIQPNYRYQIGGSLPENALTYVIRQADEALYLAAKAGDFCYVLNSRQMGKSSLLVRATQRLSEEQIACATIDLSDIGNQQISLDQWYGGVAYKLVSAFNLFDPVAFMTWWQERSLMTPVQRFQDLIEEKLLKIVQSQIVIFIDEIDSVLSFKDSLDDFFILIRSCYNKRAQNSDYQRLTFVLLGVATPSDLISDSQRTPFNIGRPIELQGFSVSESRPLLTGLNAKFTNAEQVLNWILSWTSGQPFLTQKLCQIAIEHQENLSDLDKNTFDNLVHDRVIENWENQDEPPHLKTIRDRILKNPKRAGRLLSLYQKVLHSGHIEMNETALEGELKLSGLVVIRDGKLVVNNRIYETIFNSEWVEKCLFDCRPYAESLAAWIESHGQDYSRLLRGQALQDALGWSAGKSLSNEDYQFLAASQEAQLSELRHQEEQHQTEILRLRREKELLEQLSEEQAQRKRMESELQKERQWRSQLQVAAGSIAILILAALTGVFWLKSLMGDANAQINTLSLFSKALLESNKGLDALMESIRAGREMRQSFGINANTKIRALMTLHEVVHHVQEKNRLEGHSKTVISVAFSPDGQTIASGSDDYTVKLWNRQGHLLQTFSHSDQVRSVSFSPDSQLIASASYDHTVKLWRQDGTLIQTLTGHSDKITMVKFSPDGRHLASASADGTVKLWRINGQAIATLKGHRGWVTSVSFSPNGQQLASAATDGIIELWNLNGELIQLLNAHSDSIRSVEFSPDGQRLASASNDGQIKLWRFNPSDDLVFDHGFSAHSGIIWSVAFSPDGNRLASASADQTVKIWNLSTQIPELQHTLKGHSATVYSVSFSPDGKTLASGSGDETVRLWNLETPQVTRFTQKTTDLSFSPDSQILATTGHDHTIQLWSQYGKRLQQLEDHHDQVLAVAFSPDGQGLASSGMDRTIKLWKRHQPVEINLESHFPLTIFEQQPLKTLDGHLAPVSTLSYSPTGDQMASAGVDQTIRLWNPKGQLWQILRGHEDRIYRLSFSSNGKTLASASADRTIKLWTRQGQLLKTLTEHRTQVSDVQFSPDGKLLASASLDGTVRLWDHTGTLLSILKHTGQVITLSFSPDSQTLATGTSDQMVKLWHRDGTLLHTLTEHHQPIVRVAFSPNGKRLASASQDGEIILWNLDLDILLKQGCQWVADYLQTNPNLEPRDRRICQGI